MAECMTSTVNINLINISAEPSTLFASIKDVSIYGRSWPIYFIVTAFRS